MYSFFFANRFLRSRKINLICVLGIALGVMTMTVVVSVMRGFGHEFRDRVRGMLSGSICSWSRNDFSKYSLQAPSPVIIINRAYVFHT